MQRRNPVIFLGSKCFFTQSLNFLDCTETRQLYGSMDMVCFIRLTITCRGDEDLSGMLINSQQCDGTDPNYRGFGGDKKSIPSYSCPEPEVVLVIYPMSSGLQCQSYPHPRHHHHQGEDTALELAICPPTL